MIEKGAANVSIIRGTLTPQRAQAMSSRGRGIDPAGGQPYRAAAMSLVFHAASPMVPTLRADVRVFEVGEERWYGGGCDLTPAYLFDEDAQEFHTSWKQVCHGMRYVTKNHQINKISIPPPPLYKLRPCSSYSKRRDRNNCVCNCSAAT